MASLEELKKRFAIPNVVAIDAGQGGLTRLRVTPESGSAEVYLHGGHVAAFKPAGHDPVLFVSAKSSFEDAKPIRGGVPVCFPWFGARAEDPKAALHGFVRLRDWSLEGVDREKNGDVTVVMSTASNEKTLALWPHAFELKHRVTVGASLTMSLEMRNTGRDDLMFEEALHTYFSVSDVRKVRVSGLEKARYWSNVDKGQHQELDAPLMFTGETDRLYTGTTANCVIEDLGLRRKIHVDKSHSRTTVVWNPWIDRAKAMPDFGDDEWPKMLCIETVNARADAVPLPSGGLHAMTARIHVERL